MSLRISNDRKYHSVGNFCPIKKFFVGRNSLSLSMENSGRKIITRGDDSVLFSRRIKKQTMI